MNRTSFFRFRKQGILFATLQIQIIIRRNNADILLFSTLSRATPATRPPSVAASWFSIKPCASVLTACILVNSSPSAVKMSSSGVMWSRRFSDGFVKPLMSLCSFGVTPNVPFGLSLLIYCILARL